MKITKRVISALLITALMMGLCTTTFAESKSTYKYVAIGDSTSNGYNSDEFEYNGMNGLNCGSNPRIYPSLVTSYLKNALGRDVNATYFLPEGIRAHDLRAVLDPAFEGDRYCRNHILQWSDRYGDYTSLHNTFAEALAEADLVSIDVCMSALGNYMVDRAECALGTGDKNYDEYYGNDLIKNYLGGDYDTLIHSITGLRSSIKEILDPLGLPENAITRLMDTLEYSIGTTMINFSECVKLIYELNDDVQLIAISPYYTTCYDLVLNYNFTSFSLGAVMKQYLGVMYNYMIYSEPNRDRYKLADMYSTVLRCFTDGIADGEWDSYQYVTNEIRQVLLSYGVPVNSSDPEQEQYFNNTVKTNVEKAMANNEFNIASLPFDVISVLLNQEDGLINSLVQAAADDYDNASETERLALRWVLVFQSWGCHPDYSGHQQKFEAIKAVYENSYTASYTGILNLKNTISSIINTIKQDGSVARWISKAIRNSSFGIITPRSLKSYKR